MLPTLTNSKLSFLFIISKKTTLYEKMGRGGFEPPKRTRNRFTVCPLWPLGNLPKTYVFNKSWWFRFIPISLRSSGLIRLRVSLFFFDQKNASLIEQSVPFGHSGTCPLKKKLSRVIPCFSTALSLPKRSALLRSLVSLETNSILRKYSGLTLSKIEGSTKHFSSAAAKEKCTFH